MLNIRFVDDKWQV